MLFRSGQQGKMPDRFSAGEAAEGAAAVREGTGDRERPGIRDARRQGAGQKQHLVGYESPVQGGGGGGEQGVPPQSAASVREDVLWAGEGYRAAGRYFGAFQY